MAIYHYHTQVFSRSKGQNAVAAAAYRSSEELIDETTGEKKFYAREIKPVDFILAPPDVPEWVYDRQKLWNEVEKVERRKDSQLAREMDIALPRELSFSQQEELVRTFVNENFVDHGMIADVAIHRDDLNNPHCHIMLTMRHIDENGFGKKAREWNPEFRNTKGGTGFVAEKNTILHAREMWAKYANEALERAGFEERITHLRLEDGTIKLIPTQHLGYKQNDLEKQGITTPTGDLNREIKKHNVEVLSFHEEKRKIEEERKQQKEFDDSSVQDKIAIKNAAKLLRQYADYSSCEKRLDQLNNWERKVQSQLQKEPHSEELQKKLQTIEGQRKVMENALKAFENEAIRELPKYFTQDDLSSFSRSELARIHEYTRKFGLVEPSHLPNIIEYYQDEKALDQAKRYTKDLTYEKVKTELAKLDNWNRAIESKQLELIKGYEVALDKEAYQNQYEKEFKDVFAQEDAYKAKKAVLEKAFKVLEERLVAQLIVTYPEWSGAEHVPAEQAKQMLDMNQYYGRTLRLDEFANIPNMPLFKREERREIHETLQELREVKKLIREFEPQQTEEAKENLPLLKAYEVQQKEKMFATYNIDIEDSTFKDLFYQECKYQEDDFMQQEQPKITYQPNYESASPTVAGDVLGEILWAVEQAQREADRRTQERQRSMKRKRNFGLDL
ncbi:hypothetical protein BIV60_12080 [Bacillus sp. MUM 116]|uniref:MobQ family relaxase n=1 Tax=Bacillus sp. MUM 116 TaxID=1678002 RepID=UPI0008F56035|nr:MobQ family relaxase [Bacillus sp. MUM 116]OIK14238.1 hypothetical protein BIV60_12080 [Bacillus sp. MUM 116]